MQYPYIACDYLLHVLLLKLVKMLAKTPPTHHWTGRPLPVYVYDQHSFQPLRVIPKACTSVFGSRRTLVSTSYATTKTGKSEQNDLKGELAVQTVNRTNTVQA